jgi:signal peptidase I
MPELLECRGVELYELGKELAGEGACLHVEVRGWSMYPFIRDGDNIKVVPAALDEIEVGDVVLFRSGDRLLAHRVVGYISEDGSTSIRARGDRFRQEDPPFGQAELVGRVATVCRYRRGSQRVIRLDRGFSKRAGSLVARSRVVHRTFRWAARARQRLENLTAKVFLFSSD